MKHNVKHFMPVTPFVDSRHPDVVAYAEAHTRQCLSKKENAIALFYAVCDGSRYDPCQIDLSIRGLKASITLKNGYGWCVSKAVLLTAACRSLGIQAKPGFADVKNHLASEKMIDNF